MQADSVKIKRRKYLVWWSFFNGV